MIYHDVQMGVLPSSQEYPTTPLFLESAANKPNVGSVAEVSHHSALI